MVPEIKIDAKDFEQLGRAIAGLPGEIKAKAMARAMRRMRDMARTRIVRWNADRIDVAPSKVRELTTARFNAGGNTVDIVVASGWIPLYKLGASQTAEGVSVALRGSYKSAFIATMKSGHTGVFKRGSAQGSPRLPIRELFGPNPAHDVTNNPDAYLEIMAKLIEERLTPRVLHELDRLLPK